MTEPSDPTMTDAAGATAGAGRSPDPDDLALVRRRTLVERHVEIRFGLAAGDRALVAAGETVVAGAPIAERLRDAHMVDVGVPDSAAPAPGGRVGQGELLFEWHGRWRVAGGELSEPLESPVAGIVREVQAGSAIVVATGGRAIPGVVALGGPTRGRLQVAAGKDGELRSGGLDVGFAGTILVVGSRIDAETLTRARAMGVRGIIVSGFASKERRDFIASEARQRAALHRLPPFAVLVLDGAIRRPLASPVHDLLDRLIGRTVAIVTDPPMLVFDEPDLEVPDPRPGILRVRAGEHAGVEGTWAGLLGPRRFPGGVHLEAAALRRPDGSLLAVPLGDLERYG